MLNTKDPSMRIKELEAENALLRKIVATQFKTIKRLTEAFITKKKQTLV